MVGTNVEDIVSDVAIGMVVVITLLDVVVVAISVGKTVLEIVFGRLVGISRVSSPQI